MLKSLMAVTDPWTVYENRLFGASEGRISLQMAFGRLLQSRIGFHPSELSETFTAPGDDGENDAARDIVRMQAELMTEALVSGHIPAFARPIGGGSVVALPIHTWELDDPLVRYAFASLNLESWADIEAEPTHRIFLHSEKFLAWAKNLQAPETLSDYQIDRISDPLGLLVRNDEIHTLSDSAASNEPIPEPKVDNSLPGVGPRLIPLKDVVRRVGISRSTIYGRIKTGQFPDEVKIGKRSFWEVAEIDTWIDQQIKKSKG